MSTVLWLHDGCLRPCNPAFRVHPDAPAIFVLDDARLREQGWSLKRIVFVYECLLELPVTIRRGDTAMQVAAFARQHEARQVVTVASPDPWLAKTRLTLQRTLPVQVLPDEPFVTLHRETDLKRFSRYWPKAERALGL